MNPNTSLDQYNPAAANQAMRNMALPAVLMPPVGMPQEAEPVETTTPLSHYLWVLRRQRWKIIPFVLICLISTLIVSKRLTPIYESTVTVDVDRHIPSAVVGQEASQATPNDADQFLATQIKLIQSDAVLRPVAERYNLREAADPSIDELRAKDAPVALRNLKVSRPPNTYLLLISYRSTDPVLA